MIWYGHHHLVLVISISEAPSWSPSSPAWHLDLHHRVAIGVVTPTMLLQLLISFSGKVKHYIALNDWHTGHTIIKGNPMAPAGCRIHRHASRDNLYKTWLSHTSNISHHVFDHIISEHTLQKQVRRPLLCCCMFYVVVMMLRKVIEIVIDQTYALC